MSDGTSVEGIQQITGEGLETNHVKETWDQCITDDLQESGKMAGGKKSHSERPHLQEKNKTTLRGSRSTQLDGALDTDTMEEPGASSLLDSSTSI